MPFALPAEADSAAQLVEYLADPHRYVLAYQRLIGLGAVASEAARAGLGHENPQVRMHCCRVLDHVMDAGGISALTGALRDPAEEVRVQALHALASARDDPSPAVRKKAGWYAPGGRIYRRRSAAFR